MPVFQSVSKKLALIALFGVTIFVLKVVIPFPFDKYLVTFFQAVLLVLASFLLGPGGATGVAFIYGGLTAFSRPTTAVTIFLFAVLYGGLVDGFLIVFDIHDPRDKMLRLIASLIISSSIVGIISYYASVYILQIMPLNLIILFFTLVTGIIHGILASVFLRLLWPKLSHYIT
jgi:hypothetical protein